MESGADADADVESAEDASMEPGAAFIFYCSKGERPEACGGVRMRGQQVRAARGVWRRRADGRPARARGMQRWFCSSMQRWFCSMQRRADGRSNARALGAQSRMRRAQR